MASAAYPRVVCVAVVLETGQMTNVGWTVGSLGAAARRQLRHPTLYDEETQLTEELAGLHAQVIHVTRRQPYNNLT